MSSAPDLIAAKISASAFDTAACSANTKSISSADPYCTGSGMGRLAVEMRVSLNCDASISS